MRLTSRKQVLDCEERFKDMYSRNLIRGFEVKDEPLLSETEEMKEEIQSMDDEDDDTFLNFNDGDDDLTSDLSATADAERKTRSKGKAKSKPKKAKQDKKTKTKRPINKDDETELTEAAVSGEKKKGETDSIEVCTITQDADGLETFTCHDCDRPFFTKDTFAQHYKHIHLKLRPSTYPCPICEEPVFPHKRSQHMESKHGRPAPTCNICGKKFPQPHFVLRHQRTVHMGEKNYRCDQCDKSFPEKRYLERHALAHMDIRNFACDLCGKRFKWKKNLYTHMDIHMNVRRHVCAVCGETFVQLSSLNYHMYSRHPEVL
ncbi:uncharacterized protein isoform X7 [Choristoneura fumiferana]|uniref:uncharacterized protein isoform X7 n=1 Tax=Choristoneura fumiferana TaxID=7141 RepID=UPI003D15C7F0